MIFLFLLPYQLPRGIEIELLNTAKKDLFKTMYSEFDHFVYKSTYEPLCEKAGLLGFLTRSDTNRAVQPQKMARLELSDLGSRGIVLAL